MKLARILAAAFGESQLGARRLPGSIHAGRPPRILWAGPCIELWLWLSLETPQLDGDGRIVPWLFDALRATGRPFDAPRAPRQSFDAPRVPLRCRPCRRATARRW